MTTKTKRRKVARPKTRVCLTWGFLWTCEGQLPTFRNLVEIFQRSVNVRPRNRISVSDCMSSRYLDSSHSSPTGMICFINPAKFALKPNPLASIEGLKIVSNISSHFLRSSSVLPIGMTTKHFSINSHRQLLNAPAWD